MEDISIGLALIAGLLSFVSPCVLPLVPAYIGYMGGRMTRNIALETGSKTKVGATPSTNRATLILHGIAFVLGFTMVFVAIGLMTTAFVSLVGSSVSIFTEIIGRTGGIIIIIFGLHFMGALRRLFTYLKSNSQLLDSPLTTITIALFATLLILWGFVSFIIALPVILGLGLFLLLGGAFTHPKAFWLSTIQSIESLLYSDTRQEMTMGKSGGLGGSFVMGVIFSAGWTPCIGPLLGTILTVAAQTGDVGIALPMLTAYSLGLGIPFLLTAILLEGAQAILKRLQRYMGIIEVASGALLIFIGILVTTGRLASISQNLSPDQVDFSIRIEECGLGFFQGNLTFEQAQSCIGGTLHPIALGQSFATTLDTTQPQTFIFTVQESMAVDVEFLRMDAPFAVDLRILDTAGAEIARSTESMIELEEARYLVLANALLPSAGSYRVEITNPEATTRTFRFRVRAHEPLSSEATSQLPLNNLNTIESVTTNNATTGLDIGQRAPDFTITTIEGTQTALHDLRGQVVLINFWGTWCGPCRREMPDLQAIYERYQPSELTILALATQPDTTENVTAFQTEFGLTFPLAVDDNNTINDLYGIQRQPSTLILDQNGIIIYKHFGIVPESEIIPIVEQAIGS